MEEMDSIMTLAEYLASYIGYPKDEMQTLINAYYHSKENIVSSNNVDMFDSYSSDAAASKKEELDDADKYGDFSGCSYPDGDEDR